MKTHGMLDLETLSVDVHYHPVVLSVGIATSSGLEFYAELPTSAQVGRHRRQLTLDWWADQQDNLPERAAALTPDLMRRKLLACALVLNKVDYLWSNGAGFDIPILQSLFAEHKIAWPLKYNSPRCFRTLAATFDRSFAPTHNALSDAKEQLQDLKHYYNLANFE